MTPMTPMTRISLRFPCEELSEKRVIHVIRVIKYFPQEIEVNKK